MKPSEEPAPVTGLNPRFVSSPKMKKTLEKRLKDLEAVRLEHKPIIK
jgi:hypothetical protein